MTTLSEDKELEHQLALQEDARIEWRNKTETIEVITRLNKVKEDSIAWLAQNPDITENIIRYKIGQIAAVIKTINLIKYGRYEHE